MDISILPTVNAALNGSAAVLLSAGFVFIKRKNIAAHKICMAAAFIVSTVFLASYLYYHAHAGVTHFTGTGLARALYFSILLSHTVLAVVIVPLILMTYYRALRGQFDLHRRWARWTWPLWIYVSITGVLIYCILYHLYRPSGGL